MSVNKVATTSILRQGHKDDYTPCFSPRIHLITVRRSFGDPVSTSHHWSFDLFSDSKILSAPPWQVPRGCCFEKVTPGKKSSPNARRHVNARIPDVWTGRFFSDEIRCLANGTRIAFVWLWLSWITISWRRVKVFLESISSEIRILNGLCCALLLEGCLADCEFSDKSGTRIIYHLNCIIALIIGEFLSCWRRAPYMLQPCQFQAVSL